MPTKAQEILDGEFFFAYSPVLPKDRKYRFVRIGQKFFRMTGTRVVGHSLVSDGFAFVDVVYVGFSEVIPR